MIFCEVPQWHWGIAAVSRMADEDLLRKIQGLDDLDLAALLCLVSREHCIISTEPEALDDLVDELQLVGRNPGSRGG